jgi:pyruvate dehydrogenase E2 component (dihydrolipoamide acetyltransferase)
MAGQVLSIAVSEGGKVKQVDLLLSLSVQSAASDEPVESGTSTSEDSPEDVPDSTPTPEPDDASDHGTSSRSAVSARQIAASEAKDAVYAGPAVRRMARELGLDLGEIKGSGPKNRLVKEDLQNYVKNLASGKSTVSTGSGIPQVPEVDFSQFGEIDVQPRTKMAKLTATNMHRSWLNVPHVSHFDEADITELEAFRKEMKVEAEKAGVKITPIPFLIKACALALKTNPAFNVSISQDGENVIQKHYYHIGMAVDTPAGLLVPVLRDADKKSVYQIAEEIAELATKAKDRKLKPAEMQGGCFTISSLGGIGGTGFTPIVNTPEVGILGVSKLETKPKWNGTEFEPRQMLPLILSYDHRAINGGDAGRFMTTLTALLSDIRRMVL